MKTSIDTAELAELREKAAKYDKICRQYAKNGASLNQISAEERSARAKKAVEARIAKLGQKRRK